VSNVSNFYFFLTVHLTTPSHYVVIALRPHCQYMAVTSCTLAGKGERESGWGDGEGEEEGRGEYNTHHATRGRRLTHIRLEELQMLVRRLRKFGRAEKERYHN